MSTKLSISKNLKNKLDIPLNDTKVFFEIFLMLIKKESRSKKVKINGFGVFYFHTTPNRIGRNPKTLESYIIRPTKKLIFKASSKTKEILN